MTINQLYKTPSLVLFSICILPIIFRETAASVWAYLTMLVITFFAVWAYSIVKALLQKNRYDNNLKLKKFSIKLILITTYVIALSIYFALTYNKTDEPKWMILIIIIGQILFAYGVFSVVTFIAKTISTIDTKRAVTFADYAGNFFMLLFFPFGVWWLVPKIKSLTE